MVRPLRIEYPGAWYHVACRGNRRTKIFEDNKDRNRFLKALTESSGVFNVEVHCYVLLDNHFHLLLRTPEANLGRFMQRFNTAYITYYNLRHHKSGHLYQGRYKAILVEADEYLLELSRYIHLNPVRFKKYRDTPSKVKSRILKFYKWSSLPGYIRITGRDEFMHYAGILAYMGGDDQQGRSRYRDFVLRGLLQNVDNPLEEARAGAILGSDTFVGWVKEQFLDLKTLKNQDYSGLKELKRIIPVEEIAGLVAANYGIKPGDILAARSKYREARQILIELSYRLNFRKKSLRELGEELGGISSAALTHTHRRIGKKSERDKMLSQRLNRICQELISQ